MRSARILGSTGQGNVYHVTNRCLNKECFLKDSADKEHFTYLLFRHAKVMGVEVITFCIMDNHFHILVRVPEREDRLDDMTDDEVLRRFQPVYPGERWNQILGEWQKVIDSESASWRKAFISKFRDRLFRLDRFVSELKGMFAVYFNKKYERSGTIWGDRFHSVLVEEDPEIMRLMAAYIDLNPVRAGLVDDPMNYRFCGYAKALAGSSYCQRQLMSLYKGEHTFTWQGFAAMYRMRLFGKGREVQNANGKVVKKGIDPEKLDRVVHDEEGGLSLSELLKHKTRYLTEGLAIGSESFVAGVFESCGESLGKRKNSKSHIPDLPALSSFRTLKSVRTHHSK